MYLWKILLIAAVIAFSYAFVLAIRLIKEVVECTDTTHTSKNESEKEK